MEASQFWAFVVEEMDPRCKALADELSHRRRMEVLYEAAGRLGVLWDMEDDPPDPRYVREVCSRAMYILKRDWKATDDDLGELVMDRGHRSA